MNERDTEILETLVGLAGGDAEWFFEIPVGADQIPSSPGPGRSSRLTGTRSGRW